MRKINYRIIHIAFPSLLWIWKWIPSFFLPFRDCIFQGITADNFRVVYKMQEQTNAIWWRLFICHRLSSSDSDVLSWKWGETSVVKKLKQGTKNVEHSCLNSSFLLFPLCKTQRSCCCWNFYGPTRGGLSLDTGYVLRFPRPVWFIVCAGRLAGSMNLCGKL